MNFVASGMLFGAAAVGVPIALHFLYKARYRKLPRAAIGMRLNSVAALVLLAALGGCDNKQPTKGGQKGTDTPIEPPESDDKARSQGTWVVVSMDKKTMLDEDVQANYGTIKGDLLTIRLHPLGKSGPAHKEYFALVLDSSRSPKQVDLIESNEAGDTEIQEYKLRSTNRTDHVRGRFQGIYKFEGEELIVASATESGAERPTEFMPKPAANRLGKTPDERSAVIVIHAKKKAQ